MKAKLFKFQTVKNSQRSKIRQFLEVSEKKFTLSFIIFNIPLDKGASLFKDTHENTEFIWLRPNIYS